MYICISVCVHVHTDFTHRTCLYADRVENYSGSDIVLRRGVISSCGYEVDTSYLGAWTLCEGEGHNLQI